jgi:rhodanese-related sulfurtransferase
MGSKKVHYLWMHIPKGDREMSRRSPSFKLLLLIAVLSIFALSGCGGTTTETTVATTQATTTTEAMTTTTEAMTTTTEAMTTTTEAMVDEYQVLADYLAGRLADWKPTISADALYENLTDGDESNDPLIISVRAPEIYAVGHIQGAVNIPWKTIADPDNLAKLPMDRQIVVYCYTGHTGQVAATLLMSFGYDVTNLKFGMMGWSNDPDVVGTTPFSEAPGYPTETEAHELSGSYDPPVLDTGESDGAAIAIARAQQFLADWSPTISADALYENLTDGDDSNNPFLISVRAPDIYAVGHVQGAVDIPWKSIADTSLLAGVPSDQPIVDYCYTGHTGQVAATILKLLGYDVQNMKFGMMGWSNDLDVVGTTPFSAAPGYPTETEAHTLP